MYPKSEIPVELKVAKLLLLQCYQSAAVSHGHLIIISIALFLLPTRKVSVEAGRKLEVASALTAFLPVSGHSVSLFR